MQFTAIQAGRWVEAWKPVTSGENRRVCLMRALTALCHGLMMILGVGAATEGTGGMQREASRLWMTTECAPSAKGHTCVNTCRRDDVGHHCYEDGVVRKVLRPGARL